MEGMRKEREVMDEEVDKKRDKIKVITEEENEGRRTEGLKKGGKKMKAIQEEGDERRRKELRKGGKKGRKENGCGHCCRFPPVEGRATEKFYPKPRHENS